MGILRSRLDHVRNKKHRWNIRFLLRGVIEGRKKKENAINFCNVIKINRDVAALFTWMSVNAMSRKFLSRQIYRVVLRHEEDGTSSASSASWLSPRDNNRKSLSLSGADSSYGATEIPDITDQVVNYFVIYRSFKGNVPFFFFVYNIYWRKYKTTRVFYFLSLSFENIEKKSLDKILNIF